MHPLPLAACAALACTVALPLAAQQRGELPVVTPAAGLVLASSARIAPGLYRLSADSGVTHPVLVVRGDSITLDLTGVTFEGTAPETDPDQARGLAILIDGGTGVRILGGSISGYKVGILARGVRGLEVLGTNLSHNWKPLLKSGVEKEHLDDWLSFHHNDAGEWLRYGAGLYLEDVTGGIISDVRIEQGMNGIMLTRTDSVTMDRNIIEFNSGVGIGLYRSNHNVIIRNQASFNVRGYSHGFYRRGQDSAALLIYEQSCGNFVAWNTMTHSGDGLFLWAGQYTMDTGMGGSNDNLFYRNDFSFAPTNGIEATFSRNRFIANRVEGADHGLWGGYSFESVVQGNEFIGNRIGIAIEHGQDNTISENSFEGDTTGIRLWADSIEPSDWGYPRHRDTRGRDYLIAGNTFSGNRVALRVRGHTGLEVQRNTFAEIDTVSIPKNLVPPRTAQDSHTPQHSHTPQRSGTPLGRAAIIVDQWGPYDWRSPKLWPAGRSDTPLVRLRVLGPAGSWTLVEKRGISSLSQEAGVVGDTLTVALEAGRESDWSLLLEYHGAVTVSPRGTRREAGEAYRFGYGPGR